MIRVKKIAHATYEVPDVDKQVEYFANRALTVRRSGERKMILDLVAIPTAVTLLHDVPGGREVGDDSVGAALRDAERCRDVSESDPRVVRDADQSARMAGEEAPLRHTSALYHLDSRNRLPVLAPARRLGSGSTRRLHGGGTEAAGGIREVLRHHVVVRGDRAVELDLARDPVTLVEVYW